MSAQASAKARAGVAPMCCRGRHNIGPVSAASVVSTYFGPGGPRAGSDQFRADFCPTWADVAQILTWFGQARVGAAKLACRPILEISRPSVGWFDYLWDCLDPVWAGSTGVELCSTTVEPGSAKVEPMSTTIGLMLDNTGLIAAESWLAGPRLSWLTLPKSGCVRPNFG